VVCGLLLLSLVLKRVPAVMCTHLHASTELVGQIPTSYIRAGVRWARKENPFLSDLNRHTMLLSKERTLAR
jgi:hypothetical protein